MLFYLKFPLENEEFTESVIKQFNYLNVWKPGKN